MGTQPNAEHDPHLTGVAWVNLSCLLDRAWCASKLHRFAAEQARQQEAVRLTVR